MSHYVFSNFPINQGLSQHKGQLDSTNEFFECGLLASRILGVECSDTAYSGTDEDGNKVIYFQITPDSHEASTENEEANYEAFNYYFYQNYGMERDRCYFATPYEAFYNLIKAWAIWETVLDEPTKLEFRKIVS